ncbi:MAG TPA: hypothetical protein VGQ87_02820 [Patescibacteria group bacterium]|jgi:hypothetical protein|nr:hypothetical protein [Patescibacteria group bacterium]
MEETNLSPSSVNNFTIKKLASICIAVLVLLGGIALFRPKPVNSTLTGKQIAEQAFTFLNKTLDPAGGFYYKFECATPKKDCTVGAPYDPVGHSFHQMPPHFGHLLLAFRDMGKKTGDTTYTKKADTAMDFILMQCEKDIDYCLWNFSPLIVYWNETKAASYKNAMLKASEELLKDRSLADHLALNSGLKLKALYDVTADKSYLALLVKNADKITAGELDKESYNPVLYTQDSLEVRGETIKAIWADILPAYNASKDEKYLSFARDYLNKAKLSEHLSQMPTTSELQLLVYALDSLWQLSTLDTAAKDTYLAEAHKIAQYVYQTYADTPKHLKFNGDYGFVDKGVKDSLMNGWIVREFIRLSEDTFSS